MQRWASNGLSGTRHNIFDEMFTLKLGIEHKFPPIYIDLHTYMYTQSIFVGLLEQYLLYTFRRTYSCSFLAFNNNAFVHIYMHLHTAVGHPRVNIIPINSDERALWKSSKIMWLETEQGFKNKTVKSVLKHNTFIISFIQHNTLAIR